MISSKFFIINQGMELGDKTPISPLMGAKPSLVFPFFFFSIFLFVPPTSIFKNLLRRLMALLLFAASRV